MAKEMSLPQNYLLGQRQVGDSDNTHVDAGTHWQHRTCPTLIKNLHCFWPMHVLPKACTIFASGLQQRFQSILHSLKEAFGQALQ